MNEEFRMIILANRPNWPFQGNDFFAECGELFSSHPISNPPLSSLLSILQNYAPSLPSSCSRFIFDFLYY